MYCGGLVLLALIYTGYVSLFNYKWKLPVEFAPAVISCSISTLMLIAGFLDVMVPMIYVIGMGGLLSLGYVFLKKKWKIFEEKRAYVVYGLWLAILAFFIVSVQGKLVVHIDNFSHWARIVKFLLLTDKLPSSHDDIIVFKGYPLSSSVFIYFICKVIGTAEDCYIFAQGVLLISFLLPLSVFIHRNNILCGLIVAAYGIFALNVNVSIYDLLVDTLMPLAGVALFCMIFYGFIRKSNFIVLIWMIVPLEIFLIQVKNSGIFFFLACIFYFMMCLKSLRIAKLQRLQIVKSFIGLGIGVPLLSIVLWYCHLNSAFEDSVFDSPHVVSIRHYQHVLEGKSIADIWSIFFNMVRVWGDFYNISTVLFILGGLLLGIALMCCCHKKDFKSVSRRFLFHTIYVLGVFFLYIIAMFLMYVFSMPRAEAVTLACYDRYMLSVDIFILGIIVAFLITQKYGRFYRQFSFVGSLAILVVFLLVNFSVISKNESSSLKHEWIKYRYDFHQFIQNQPIRAQRKYLLYMNRNDSVYAYLLMAYELWSNYGSVSSIPSFSELLYYDYLIIWTPDDISMAYLRDNGLEKYAKFQPLVIPLKYYRATY